MKSQKDGKSGVYTDASALLDHGRNQKKTVSYATFCCEKDKDRAHENFLAHFQSHNFTFDEVFFVHQRCKTVPIKVLTGVKAYWQPWIMDSDYPEILSAFGIPYPDPVLDELTHGWGAPHFWAHHCVNHLKACLEATSEYIVFADADCYMKDQPEGKSWIDEGIRILESDPHAFVVSPNDGGPGRAERIMSQQMFLVRRSALRNMTMIPWDGKFIEGGPFQEYFGLLEGRIGRFMEANNLYRYVLPPEFRYYHLQWH